jgi:hypothetical protein
MYQFTRRAITLTVAIVVGYHCYQLTKYRHSISATDHIFCIHQILEKKMGVHETEHHLFVDFKKSDDLVRREALCSILIDFEVSMKLVRLIKMCLNKTYSKVHIGKHLSDQFLIQNDLKQGDALS